MMEFAKDLASNIGCATSDFAKMVGSNTADFAKMIGSNTADFAKMVGGNTADLAKRVGSGTVDLAERIGPKRALIGLAIIGGAVVGGIYLARYLRNRAAEADEIAGTEGIKNKRVKRAAVRAQHAAQGIAH